MSRTISVKGKARVTAPADITGVEATVKGHRDDFEAAINAMTEMTVSLKDAIEAAGIPRGDLRTSDVSVRQAYRKVKIGTDRYGADRFKDVADGFDFTQNIVFEFSNDNSKLSKAISGILACGIEPRIDLYFRSSDREGMKNRALADACRNAKTEAETILQSVGARLGSLLSVDRNVHRYYDDDDLRMNLDMCIGAKCNSMEMEVDPEDVSVDEDVTMVWEIEG